MANAMSEYHNLKARLIAQKERKERELSRINSLLESLDEAKEIVQDTVVEVPGGNHHSYSLVDHVRKMLDRYATNDVISVSGLVSQLKKEGIGGKNLYNNVYTTLVREVRRKRLQHEKNVGFFKGDKTADTLVASVGAQTVLDREHTKG